MNIQYSIRDIEKLTGVKAHTLRIWEQRFGFVIPHRTDTNIRFYDDEQLKILLNVSILLKHGRKISKVAYMSAEAIKKELVRLTMDTQDKDLFYGMQVDSLVVAMIDLDEEHFEKVISLCNLRFGFEQTMVCVITPFLGKVGILWSIGEVNVAQEHFISNLVRQKLIVAIDGYIGKSKNDIKYLLFLPEGEYHELGLLFAKYLIRAKGFQVIYLGQSLPYHDLVKLCVRYQPDYILTYFTSGMNRISIEDYLDKLSSDVACENILICGPIAKLTAAIGLAPKVTFIETVNDLVSHLSMKTAV